MRFKGKVAPYWYAIIAVVNVLAVVVFAVYGVHKNSALYMPLLIVIDLYTIPVLFKNYVEVDRNSVKIYFGLLTKTIVTKEIKSVKDASSYQASFAAASDRIAIDNGGQNPIYISIIGKKDFYKELTKSNRNIKYLV